MKMYKVRVMAWNSKNQVMKDALVTIPAMNDSGPESADANAIATTSLRMVKCNITANGWPKGFYEIEDYWNKEVAAGFVHGGQNEQNCNKVNADNGVDKAFGKDKRFSVVCNKCGSMDVEIIGTRGINYCDEPGYQEGSMAFKCNGCGSGLTAWE